MRSLRTRLTLVFALLVLIAFAVASLLAWQVVQAAISRDLEARLTTALTQLASGVGQDSSGLLSLERTPDEAAFNQSQSGWYWLISDGGRILARSRSLSPADDSLERLAAEAGGTAGDIVIGKETLRVLTRDVSIKGRSADPLQARIAGPTRIVRSEVWRTMRILLVALGIVAILLILAMAFELRRGLAPLKRLSSEIDGASRGKATQISHSGFVEIDPVVDGINHLIGQMTGVIDRARAQAGNLAHAIKTPLSLILARNRTADGPQDQDIRMSVDMIERQIGRHLKRARFAGRVGLASEPVGARAVVADIVLVMANTYQARDLTIDTDIPADATFLVEREDLEEMIGNLADNACKWARDRVALSVAQDADSKLAVIVDDDGPGLPPEAMQDVLARGHRLDDTIAGAGLGLTIVVELTQLYGGSLDLSRSPLGGLRARLLLPAAPVRAST